MRRCALCMVLGLSLPGAVAAQDGRRVLVEAPECPPGWYDGAAFVDALRVELAGHDIDVVQASSPRAAAGTRLRLARAACDDEGGELLVSLDGDAQPIALGDLDPDARLRTLAIITADRVLVLLASASRAPPPAPPTPSLAPSLAAALGGPSRELEAEPADELRAPTPARPAPFELRLGAGGLLLVTARSLDVFGGGSFGAELSFGPVPLSVRLGALVLHGVGQHALGQVSAVGIGGELGVGFDLRAEVFRVAPRLELGVVHFDLHAEAARAGVSARSESQVVVWIEPAVSLGIDLDRFWLALELGAPLVVRGVEARAAPRPDLEEPVLAIGGVLLEAALTLGARFDL